MIRTTRANNTATSSPDVNITENASLMEKEECVMTASSNPCLMPIQDDAHQITKVMVEKRTINILSAFTAITCYLLHKHIIFQQSLQIFFGEYTSSKRLFG